jgi:arylsulfatase A-like enzyme
MGRLMETLERLPAFAENTLAVYISDYGDFMGNHGLINRKEYPHEELVRVPAIFHWPGQLPAQP